MARMVWCVVMSLVISVPALAQSRVATPTFSAEGGDYSTVVLVVVEVDTPGAVIRVTQNGHDPTETDPVVASGATIAINTPTTLKARAWKYGWHPSEVRMARYTFTRAPAAPPSTPVGPGDVSARGGLAIVALPSGKVLSWAARGQPDEVAGLQGVTAVAAGTAHALAVTWDGHVYAWRPRRRLEPTHVAGLADVVDVAAGGAHSLALTKDGRVFAWGQNGRGQLGTGTRRPSRVPIAVPSLSGIVAIAAGEWHSLAISARGRLYAWGANEHAQVGDGAGPDRLSPTSVALEGVVSVAAGDAHTLALREDGSVYTWGRAAASSTSADARTLDERPTAIPGLEAWAVAAGGDSSAAIRRDGVLTMWGAGEAWPGPPLTAVSAFALGDRHIVAVTAAGEMWTWGAASAPEAVVAEAADWGPPIGVTPPAPPGIEPPAGTFASPQSVSLAASANTEIRYTLDGTDPTPLSPVYAGPFVVSTATTVIARAYSIYGGRASEPATAVYRFNYGELPPPAAEPGGGYFRDAPAVSLSSVAGAVVRYTLDGAAPDESSEVYAGPVSLPAGGTLMARAYHADWTTSAVTTAHYFIDLEPPAITARADPPPVGGWHTSAVTVSFSCADNSDRVTCPGAVTLSSDGEHVVTGTAMDEAGNVATITIGVRVDVEPPLVAIPADLDGSSTVDTQVVLPILVTDAGSGVERALCSGAPVALADGMAECAVPLHGGVNTITVTAYDAVGHSTSTGIRVTRTGVAGALTLAPAERAMLVAEVGSLSLRDDFGAEVRGASWQSSDAGIVQLTPEDPPRLLAAAPGHAIITVVKDGLTAEAAIVVHAGAELPAGTTRWTMPATPGYTMGLPLFTHRVDASTPDLFLVERRTLADERLTASTSEGEVLWTQQVPGVPLMADSFGGIVLGSLYDGLTDEYAAYVRLGGGGVPPWRYQSEGSVLAPAQAPDGTIYAVEWLEGTEAATGRRVWDKHFMAIDGRTGRRLQRVLVDREVVEFIPSSSSCARTYSSSPADTVGPVVGSDGRGYLLVRRYHKITRDECINKGFGSPRTYDMGVDLVALSPDGPAGTHPAYAVQCDMPAFREDVCDFLHDVTELMPDGVGGMLASWSGHLRGADGLLRRQRMFTHWDAGWARHDFPGDFGSYVTMVGQAGTAFVSVPGGVSAVEVTTGSAKWSQALGTDLLPLAARPDGSLAVQELSTGDLRLLDSAGAVQPSAAPLGLAPGTAVHEFGSWIGLRNGRLTAVVGDFEDATRWTWLGNRQRQNRQRNPGIGIFAKSHPVRTPLDFQHVSIRIVPTFQQFWRSLKPTDFVQTDSYDNYFMTIGAGTAEGDSSILCTGTLTKGINRERDVTIRPTQLEALPVGVFDEMRIINDLYVAFEHYQDDLPYACVPEINPGHYNSNSFASGILRKVGAPLPEFPIRGVTVPGWATPVPAHKFER